jgi:4-hydroxy 2-oxovalerate aldolase
MSEKVKLLDCTLRDGGYYNSWDFKDSLVIEYLSAISESGVDYIELGLRSRKASGFKGMFAFCPEQHLACLPIPKSMSVGVMVNASELFGGEGVEAELARLFPVNADESCIDLVRVACHLHEVLDALPAVPWLKSRGYQVGLNLMQIGGQPKCEVVRLADAINKQPLDVLYFADSLGSMTPNEVAEIIRWLREGWQGEIGIHTHDNMGLALQNSLRALDEGATWVDSTVTGMGRGPGNSRTEELAIEIGYRRSDQRSLVPLFQLASRHFKPMQQKYGWGTNPFYYLAGKYGIHPTYIQEMLGDSRYDEADVLAVIEHLRQVGGTKFSPDALESARLFYQGETRGNWSPVGEFKGRDVLIMGAGPGAKEHSKAIETFISNHRPLVIALNTQPCVDESLVDYRIACHPVRLLADSTAHLAGRSPVIMPYSMLPPEVQRSYNEIRVHDFGLRVQPGQFEFHASGCVSPSSLVVAYALAVASSGKAQRVLMAGFDGYGADDPRTEEMEEILKLYRNSEGACPILAITPTRYQIPLNSIYLL